jgi:hypothetical protein
MWLQTSSEFSTNVRIFGHHTMTSHDVKYEPGERTLAGIREPELVGSTSKEK